MFPQHPLRRTAVKSLLICPALLGVLSTAAVGSDALPPVPDAAFEPKPIATGPFEPTEGSLGKYAVPEWFRDAKFGIWSHWGPQAVPRMGDWYARKLYLGPGYMDRKTGKIVAEAGPIYQSHTTTYGHPSKFGYKDIIPLWKAERWDPEALMALYKKAGAKYFVSMGIHHDNFALWNSPLHRWNAVNMGPKKDVVGLWQAAAKKQGLKFGGSEHWAASYNFYQPAKAADATGPFAGVPYDGADPAFADLYFPKVEPFDFNWMTSNPTFHRQWFNRIRELVDSYQPDLLYSDSKLPFKDLRKESADRYDRSEVGSRLVAHYYNSSASQHGGVAQVIYQCKETAKGRWVEDVERGVKDGILPEPWQTDTSIGDWFYRTGQTYMTSTRVIHMLADIVSKNGNLLLNIVQTPEGDLEPDVQKIVEEIGAWMAINGEAIYNTRPWVTFGEDDPSKKAVTAGHFNENKVKYTDKDLRFTLSKDQGTLYVIALGWPADGQVVVKSLAQGSDLIHHEVGQVRLLGYSGQLQTLRDEDGLKITLPAQKPCEGAFAFAVSLR